MAIFAPWLAPYDPHFLAPDEDFFALSRFNVTFGPGTAYYPPVVGPTRPTYTTPGGGIWTIVADRSGVIHMILATEPISNETPIRAGNTSYTIDIHNVRLPSGLLAKPPLSSVAYVVPALSGASTGEYITNGALAFVANSTFLLYDPFSNRTMYAFDLGFVPNWFVEDPLSAGQMYGIPQEFQECIGVVCIKFTYRYFAVGAANRTLVLRVNFRWPQDTTPVSGKVLIDRNVTLDRPALIYDNNNFLREASSGIFFPVNGTQLNVFDLDGIYRKTLNLTFGGSAASLTTPLVPSRALELPVLFASVRSTSTGSGAVLYLNSTNISRGDISVERTFALPSPSMSVDTVTDNAPESGSIRVYVAANIYESGRAVRAKAFRLDGNATIDSILQADLPEPVHDLYYVFEASRLYMLGNSGAIYSATTVSQGGIRSGLVVFSPADAARMYIRLVGGFQGSIYAVSHLGASSVYGLSFEPATGRVGYYQFIGNTLAPLPPGTYPSGNHYWLGTDNIGQDVLSWTIFGARVAFLVGVLAALSAVLVGTLVGLVAGFHGKIVDTLLMRTADIVLVLPGLPVVIILTTVLGQNVLWIVVVIAILAWPGIARVIRAQTLSLRERPFVDAARVSGASNLRIMFLHIAPNILPFTFLYMTLLVAGAILTEAALSFIGLGDAKAISWGQMLNTLNSSGSTTTAWWWLLPPGLAITILSMGFYFVGRAVDEIVNPRLRER